MGSGSVARQKLLMSAGLEPNKIVVPNIDECEKSKETPFEYVKRMALEKSDCLKTDYDAFLITADTIVVVGKTVLHKTIDRHIARTYLQKLSGRRHKVMTAFCIKHKKKQYCKVVTSVLKMKHLTEMEIKMYLDKDEWRGKAGAYSIQGYAINFFPFISGCFTNIIGLPIPKLNSSLKSLGFKR